MYHLVKPNLSVMSFSVRKIFVNGGGGIDVSVFYLNILTTISLTPQ